MDNKHEGDISKQNQVFSHDEYLSQLSDSYICMTFTPNIVVCELE